MFPSGKPVRPHKASLCFFPPVMRNTEHGDSHSSLFKRVCIYLFVCFLQKLILWGSCECLCHCKVLLETSAHSQPAAALPLTQLGCRFIYSGATLTCLFSQWSVCHWLGRKGTTIHSFPSRTYMCSYVIYNCLSYKVIREVMKSNFKMKDVLKKKKPQQKKFYLILVLFSTSCYWLLLESFLLSTTINIYLTALCHTLYHNLCNTNIKCLGFNHSNLYIHEIFLFLTYCGRSCISFRAIMERTDSQLWNSFFLGLKLPEFHDIPTYRKFTFSPPGIWEWQITMVVVGKSLFTVVIIITCLTINQNGLY